MRLGSTDHHATLALDPSMGLELSLAVFARAKINP
jgi:hypothetical protein